MKYFNPLTTVKEQLGGHDIIFDLDGTLIAGDIGETLFYHFLISESIEPKPEVIYFDPIQGVGLEKPVLLSNESSNLLIRYRENLRKEFFSEAYLDTAKWLERYKHEDIKQLVNVILIDNKAPGNIKCQAVMKDSTEAIDIVYGACIKAVMRDLVRYLQEQKARLWIVSASPQAVCEIVAEKIGIEKKRVLGVKVSNERGESARIPWGHKKIEVLKEAGVSNPLIVFGNSVGDMDMLAIAKYPVVVEDGSPELVKFAEEQGWWVYHNMEDASG